MTEEIIIYSETADGTDLYVLEETLDEWFNERTISLKKDDEGFYIEEGYGKYKIMKGRFVNLVPEKVVTKIRVEEDD